MNIIENPSSSIPVDSYLQPATARNSGNRSSRGSLQDRPDFGGPPPPSFPTSPCRVPSNQGNGSGWSNLSNMVPVSEYEELPQEGYSEVHDPDVVSPSGGFNNNTVPLPSRNPSGFHSVPRNQPQMQREQNIDRPPPYRKRYNPLYIPPEKEAPPKPVIPCKVRIALVVLIMACFVAIALSLFAVVSVFTNEDRDEVRTGKVIIPGNITGSQMSAYMADLQVQLENLQKQVDESRYAADQMSEELETMKTMMYNVSKLPGPEGSQGPPGVGDLSSCRYKNTSSGGQASSPIPTYTHWIPDATDASESVVMAVSCYVKGGNQVYMESQKTAADSLSIDQYRCACSGSLNESNRYCQIHYWLCPRLSP